MNRAIEQLLNEVSSSEPTRARNAIVRTTLILEWDTQGHLDKSAAEGFPQLGLYSAPPTDADVIGLIRGLDVHLQDPSRNEELQQSILSALSKSGRKEAFAVFTKLLNKTRNLKSLCESTDVLQAVADFLDDPIFRSNHAKDLTNLVSSLKLFTLSNPGAEAARKRIIASAAE